MFSFKNDFTAREKNSPPATNCVDCFPKRLPEVDDVSPVDGAERGVNYRVGEGVDDVHARPVA